MLPVLLSVQWNISGMENQIKKNQKLLLIRKFMKLVEKISKFLLNLPFGFWNFEKTSSFYLVFQILSQKATNVSWTQV